MYKLADIYQNYKCLELKDSGDVWIWFGGHVVSITYPEKV